MLRDRDGYRCDNFRGELLPVKSEDGREGGKAKVEKNEYAERGRKREHGGGGGGGGGKRKRGRVAFEEETAGSLIYK